MARDRQPRAGSDSIGVAELCVAKYIVDGDRTAVPDQRRMVVTGDITAGEALATLVVLVALAACQGETEHDLDPTAATTPPRTRATAGGDEGLLYGRVTADDGDTYEGRLRFGGDEEALWGNTFNGVRDGNPWADHVPDEQLPKERVSIGAFGKEIAGWDVRRDLDRPFMARLGDIARIDAPGRDLRVTLRSGTVFKLARFGADDLADGVRVWDARRGVVDLEEWGIRTIEFLPNASPGAGPTALHGTVRTRQGAFTGLVQWDRKACLGSDLLAGRVRFDDIRWIARRSGASALVTLVDGREIVLSGTHDVGEDNAGIYVDDPRYGRVLVSWDAFERLDLSPGGTAPAYDDFRPGRPLTGSVLTRSGRRLAGRLVYDLDESETTETLDAPAQGVDYMIPFRRIASIVVPGPDPRRSRRATVTLRSGEELRLELAGDLDEWNAGILVFVDVRTRPEYVPWSEVVQVDFDGPLMSSQAAFDVLDAPATGAKVDDVAVRTDLVPDPPAVRLRGALAPDRDVPRGSVHVFVGFDPRA